MADSTNGTDAAASTSSGQTPEGNVVAKADDTEAHDTAEIEIPMDIPGDEASVPLPPFPEATIETSHDDEDDDEDDKDDLPSWHQGKSKTPRTNKQRWKSKEFWKDTMITILVIIVVAFVAGCVFWFAPAILRMTIDVLALCFWNTVGLPFWWLSFHTGATPFAPSALLAAYLLFCILRIQDEPFEDCCLMGVAYVLLFLIGLCIRL